MPKPSTEQTLRVYGGRPLNTIAQNVEQGIPAKQSIEAALSVRGLTARVISATGTFVKVDWLRNNKPYQTFKMKNYSQTTALAYINACANDDGLPA